ncbi:hypothetical protein [Roseomonas sp. BN140053]|uniref:hypothetical protein n=1 Tax=Roseomonas sp. BN140053 TaxID=3391898 RepID=UPI0039E968A5
MPNVYAACWTMSEIAFNGSGAAARAGTLRDIALVADTQLKIAGNTAGGDFSRMLVVPEYLFSAGGALLSRDNKHAIYRQLENISAAVPQLLIVAGSIAYRKGTFFKDTYNVCPILLNGQIIRKLYKANDDGVYQNNGTFRTKTDGGKGVPYATIGGLNIGLDICLDYNQGRLGTYIAQNNLAAPDIHIQISGTNSAASSRSAARTGGVYLHCDLGGKGANGATAWRVTGQAADIGTATTRIQPRQVLMQGGGRLMLFDIPV